MSTAVKTAPESDELIIRKLDDQTTIFSAPFLRGRVFPIGGRSTAIALKNGKTWVIPSTALTPSTLTTLQALPPVAYLVSPDLEHHLFIAAYAAAFPDAKLYVPRPVKKNLPDELKARVAWTFGEGKEGDPFEEETGGEIKTVDFGKSFINQDIAFLHTPTRTLIEADLLFNLSKNMEQYSKSRARSWVPFLSGGFHPGTSFYKRFLWYGMAINKKAMADASKKVSAWDFDRIIPCHGNIIETGGKKAWDETYAWFLNGKL